MGAEDHRAKAGKGTVTVAIVTVSDTRTPESDQNRQYIERRMAELGHIVAAYRLIKDEPDQVAAVIEELTAMPEVQLVIYPDSEGEQYQVKTVPVEVGSFVARLDLPKPWAGLRNEELAAVTGVQDSVFCHSNLFIAGARSMDGALRLAELALK